MPSQRSERDVEHALPDILIPPGTALLESMRSVGYTVEAAVADVIDNSVAAFADTIDVLISADGPFQIAILDDGVGMSREEAIKAMTLAPARPSNQRLPSDLGRFGLGLKTASLSQCRDLTVVTKKRGVTTALRWSLDHVVGTGTWALIELAIEETQTLLGWAQFSELDEGTLVHWGELDQLERTEGDDQAALDHVALRIRNHIALVFHLFNSGDGARKIDFLMNGSAIEPTDPFMSQSKQTTKSVWETILVDDSEVKLLAYTLPYLSRLSQSERNRALALGGLRETQGFYVYRGSRLVIWGTWFRVAPRSEMAKLTRVRVEIPNSLDHLWALDVKKSSAEPPPLIRRRLSELARTMMGPSRTRQEYRGRRPNVDTGIEHFWLARVNGEEFNYEINLEHPAIEALTSEMSPDLQTKFGLLMEDLQASFPMVDAHNKLSQDKIPSSPDDASVIARASESWRLAQTHGIDFNAFFTMISRSEPYCFVTDLEVQLLRDVSHES